MKTFESKRHLGQVAVLVNGDLENPILRFEDGTEKQISQATLKRWWKEVPQVKSSKLVNLESAVGEIKGLDDKAKSEVKEEHPLKTYVEQLAIDNGTEIFITNSPTFRSLKIDGKMYMAYTFSKKGITLWLRSKAIGNAMNYKRVNHMFDARVTFQTDNERARVFIQGFLVASLVYQKTKKTKK